MSSRKACGLNCCIVGCKSRRFSVPGISYYKFPAKPWEHNRPEQWINAVRRISLENMSFNSIDEEKQDYQEELLLDFPDEERTSIFKIPATNNPEDLGLFAKLCRKDYFRGNHHIEEIMYLENLRRSQILQLLDKFRDVLITYETEDPAVAMFSSSYS